jgi:hydroxypyruvate reductase
MMDALAERVPLSGGLAVTKFASGLARESYTVLEGGHPIPDARSLEAGQRVLDFVSRLKEDDTLVCLISGGGSALVTAPYDGISLEDMQSLTSLLLSRRANRRDQHASPAVGPDQRGWVGACDEGAHHQPHSIGCCRQSIGSNCFGPYGS